MRIGATAAASVILALAAAVPAQAETRTPGNWPFAASSPWNSSIGTGALFGDATCDAAVEGDTNTPPYVPWIDTTNGVPVYQASSTDPAIHIYTSTTPGTQTPHGTDWGAYHVPVNPSPGQGDKDMVVVEPTQAFSDETFDTNYYGAWINAWDLGRHDLVNGDGFTPVTGFGPRASDASMMGGQIRTWELQAGSIRHALALTLTGSALAHSYKPPARATDNDGTGDTGPIQYGQLVAIPSTTSISSLNLTSAVGREIATAMQTYGAYVVDRSGSASLNSEPSADTLVNPARGITNGTSDWIKIIQALKCVSNNQAPPWGGGGTPLAPPPPPFG